VSEPKWRFNADGLGMAARYGPPREASLAALRAMPLEPGMRVLEVGCGSGGHSQLLMSPLRGRGEWVGVDHDEDLLAQARRNVDGGGVSVRFEKGDAFKLPFEDGAFDAVVSAFLLCVLPAPVDALREMRRVTRRGGVVASVSCFCKSGSLPIFHGVERWPGMERYAELEPRVRAAFRKGVRNPGLGLANGKDLDVWADYAKAGLVDLRIDGYMEMYAPADARWTDEESADFLERRERIEMQLFERIAKAGAHLLAPHGVTEKDVEELAALTSARYAHLRADVFSARRNMDVIADPNVLITGRVP